MKSFIFALLLIVGASCLPVRHLEDERCIDPTYACHDLPTAAKCKVVKECINDIWITMGTPDVNNEICDLCKQMVQEARDQLNSNETQEELKEVFEGSCKLIPLKPLTEGCIKLVDEFIPELIEMLTSRMDPTQVCTVSGLCVLSAQSKVKKIKEADKCEQCTVVIDEIKTFINTIPESKQRGIVLKYCTQKMGLSMSTCEEMVDSDPNGFIAALRSSDSKSLCEAFAFCPLTKPSVFKYGGDPMTCDFCKSLVQYLKTFISSKTTEEEFRAGLLNMCSDLGSYAEECKSLVNSYYDVLYKLIVEELDPQQVCSALTLCTIQKIQVQVLPEALPHNKHHISHEANTINETFTPKSISDHLKNDTDCVFCSAMILYNNINGSYDEMCEKFEPEFLSLCKDFYRRYSPAWDKLKQENANPNYWCVQSGACASVNEVKNVGDVECTLCKQVVENVKKVVNDPTSRAEVKEALDSVCSFLPSSMKAKCDQMVDQYSDMLITFIINDLDPQAACAALNLCPAAAVSNEVENVGDLQCTVCKSVVENVKKYVNDPTSRAEVKQALESACSYLPSSMTARCDQMVEKYADYLITFIVSGLDPQAACASLSLCPSVAPKKVKNVGDLKCTLCKQVVENVKKYVNDSSSRAEVKQALESACSYLPSSLTAECIQLVDQYSDKLITFIMNDLDPQAACASLNLCPAAESNNIREEMLTYCKPCTAYTNKFLEYFRVPDHLRQHKLCTHVSKEMTKKCINGDKFLVKMAHLIDAEETCQISGMCPLKADECSTCMQTLEVFQKFLQNPEMKKEVENLLETACSLLPAAEASKCNEYVTAYADKLLNYIAQMDPKMACSIFGMCASPRPSSSLECELCTELANYAQKALMDPNTQQQIINLAESVCTELPGSLKDECDSFIQQYAPALLTMLAQEMDPSVVCPSFCGNSSISLPKVSVKDETCDVCHIVVSGLDKLLNNDEIDKDISQMIEKVCYILPGSSRDQCTTIIEAYAPYIIQMLAQYADANTVCSEMHLCSTPKGHVKLYGEHKCTYGPSYWCKDHKTAHSCRAIAYCQLKAW